MGGRETSFSSLETISACFSSSSFSLSYSCPFNFWIKKIPLKQREKCSEPKSAHNGGWFAYRSWSAKARQNSQMVKIVFELGNAYIFCSGWSWEGENHAANEFCKCSHFGWRRNERLTSCSGHRVAQYVWWLSTVEIFLLQQAFISSHPNESVLMLWNRLMAVSLVSAELAYTNSL